MPAPNESNEHLERARFYYQRARLMTIVCVIASLTSVAFAIAAILD